MYFQIDYIDGTTGIVIETVRTDSFKTKPGIKRILVITKTCELVSFSR